jgi:hypothetical protein
VVARGRLPAQPNMSSHQPPMTGGPCHFCAVKRGDAHAAVCEFPTRLHGVIVMMPNAASFCCRAQPCVLDFECSSRKCMHHSQARSGYQRAIAPVTAPAWQARLAQKPACGTSNCGNTALEPAACIPSCARLPNEAHGSALGPALSIMRRRHDKHALLHGMTQLRHMRASVHQHHSGQSRRARATKRSHAACAL